MTALLTFALQNWRLLAGVAALLVLVVSVKVWDSNRIEAAEKRGEDRVLAAEAERQAELRRIERTAASAQQRETDKIGRDLLEARTQLESKLKTMKDKLYETIIDTAGRCVVGGGLRDDYNESLRDRASARDEARPGNAAPAAQDDAAPVDVATALVPVCRANAAIGAYCCKVAGKWQEWWRSQELIDSGKPAGSTPATAPQ